MPKRCPKCNETKPTDYPDNEEKCKYCYGPLEIIEGNTTDASFTDQDVFNDALEDNQYGNPSQVSEYATDDVQCIMTALSSHPILNQLPIVYDIEPNNPECITLQFYTIVRETVWCETKAICLHIINNNSFNQDMVYSLFLSLGKINISLNNKNNEFHIITSCIRIPSSFIHANCLEFIYKYRFYLKENNTELEDLCHPSKYPYYRYFYEKIDYPEQINDEPIRRFDIMVIRVKKYSVRTDPDTDIQQRRLFSLIGFLPAYMVMGESKTVDSFLEEFVLRLETLVSFLVSQKEETKSICWDTDRQQAITGLVLKYVTYLFQNPSKYELKETIIRIYLTIILFQKYSVKPEDILSIIADPLNSISDSLFSKEDFALDCIIDTKYLSNGMSNLVMNGPPKTKQVGYFQLITLYHCLFPWKDQHLDHLRKRDYSTIQYWGFPRQWKFNINHPISDKDVQCAFKLVPYDPILPYNIIYCCPLSKLDLLYRIHNSNPRCLPLQAIFALFLHKENSNSKKNMKSVIQFLIEKLSSRKVHDNIKNFDIESVFKFSLKLLSIFKVNTLNTEDYTLIIDLFIHLYLRLMKIHTVEFNDFLKVFKFIESWCKENLHKPRPSERDLQNEMKFWDATFRYPFPIEWSYWIKDHLQKRLKYKDLEQSFDGLFIFVQTKLISDDLKRIFTDEIMNRLKRSDPKNRESLVTKLGLLNKDEWKNLTDVLCFILLHEQRQFDLSPSKHLLDWPSWTLYFQFSTMDDVMAGINDQAKALLHKAIKEFFKLIHSICIHEITTAESLSYTNKKELILKLIEKSGISGLQHEKVIDGFKYCNSVTIWIENKLKNLKHLQGLLTKIPNFTHPIIKNFINGQLKNKITIAQFVNVREGQFYFTNYPEINELIHSTCYPCMSSSAEQYMDSCIFPIIFSDLLQSSQFQPQENMDFEKLFDKVWKPASEEVEELLKCCRLKTILISKVQTYFVHKNDYHSLQREFGLLSLGSCKVLSTSHKDPSEFSDCSRMIESYFELRNLSQAATVLVRLKMAYSITTDFSLIESLQDVQSNFQDKPISYINEEVIQLITKLEKFTPENLEVLDVILENINLILWVKSKLALNQLKNFVEIALTTSGDQSLETYFFSSVCTNLEAIIFPITKETTYSFLISQFRKVFSIVQGNKDILVQLTHLSKYTKFLEELIQSQGSLEETTIKQINQIAASGIFTVSSQTSLILDKMVQVTTKRDDGERKYNMEQLQDLRSKLNLIVVSLESTVDEKSQDIDKPTGCQADAAKFNSICDLLSDLAYVVKDLFDKGDIASSDYHFSCNLQEAEKVGIEINAARLTLAKRTKDIERARMEYYFLNYYTISQIVLLQKGLISFIDNSDIRCQEQMYHLLCLLPLEFTEQNVQSALERARIIASSGKSDLTNSSSFQSGSSVIQYNFIGADNSGKFVKEDKSNVTKFPENFSPKEKEIADEVLANKFSVQLITSGIESLRGKREEVKTQSLIVWCIDNENTSTDLPSKIPQYVPQQVAKFLGTDNLDIFQLGEFLKEFDYKSVSLLQKERKLYKPFKIGEPNLVLIPSYLIYESILSLYQLSPNLPLPYYGEVLICSDCTSIEEIDIFWRRALCDSAYNHSYIFCLVSIEKLQYQVAVQAVSLLWKLLQLKTNSRYKLVIICSEEEEERSYMAAALENYKRPSHIATIPSLNDINNYLQEKFSQSSNYKNEATWLIDESKSRVRLVVSDNVGAGKSFYINSLKSNMLKQKIVKEDELGQAIVTVVMHGKQASEELIIEQLLKRDISHLKHGILFHVDIASTLQTGLEQILFKLLVLGGICKRSGEFWHCRLKDYYILETTINPQNKHLVNFTKLFPSIQFIQPRLVMVANRNQPKDKSYLTMEDFRRTFAYLKGLNSNINMDKLVFDNFKYPEIQPNEMLPVLLNYCGIQDPSWAEINNFVIFLSKQLSDCDNSDYCSADLMKEDWIGFKSFVVEFLILMSRDFATPSLKGEVERNTVDTLRTHQIVDKRRWENCSHPYIFFNQDRHTMTFLGFIISNRGDLMDSIVPTTVIKPNIIRPDLMKVLKHNNVNLCEDFLTLNRNEKIDKFSKVMGFKELTDPDPGYVLTLDNVRKILAIFMRFRCNIPVVIMGETGCGKTRLIQFMCSLQAQQTGATNMLILKVHGGTTEGDVMCRVEEAEKLARHNFQNHNIDTVLFFDEANTSPAIGLIKEIMCDRRMYGRHISSDIRLQFIAACNPYRRHTKEMLHKLSTAGLGFFTKSTETTDRLGDIPLRELVYRVIELPASMRPLVWDFGQLSNDIEKTYTREIVAKHLHKEGCLIATNDNLISAISNVLGSAQSYMREKDDECSFVSLRDVERAMQAMFWFYKMLDNLLPNRLPKSKISDVTYSLILSLAVCYRARLKQRNDFDTKISKYFRHPLSLLSDYTVIELEVNKCQDYILNKMIVDEHIAKNKALRENVFMMFVCIELRIPLFVIGKPGSSKSLAKTIISHNMQGNKCQDNSVLRNFSEVHIMSYQCSQLSTSEGIRAVFENCKTMQQNTGSDKFVSCVVLDEVGLAEDSPLMPLKVLHPLLEDSSYGSKEMVGENINNSRDTLLDRNIVNQVAFIGISNWSLDPAKMNRGIMVTRDDPDKEELLLSAKEICSSRSADPKLQSVDNHVCTLAGTYLKLVETTNSSREYYGLRDFYSLIKMLVSLCQEHKVSLTSSILKHSVLRNFGGSDNRPLELFMQSIVLPEGDPLNPDSSPLGLIRANLTSSSTSFYGETRYLLLLTENYAALTILMKSSFMWPEDKLDKVRVLFGSSFPRDQNYSTACSNINKIKVCMETGKTVVLLHLELLYESLYDTLNQYYLKIYDQRFVDLGLGTHRMKCRVHNEFKLIVIADEDTVNKRFPTPLINRLEKHCLNMKTVLSNEGFEIAKEVAEWAKKFTTFNKSQSVHFERTRSFSTGDCFIGYHDDTPSFIVFEEMKRIYPNNTEVEIDHSTVLGNCQSILLKMATTDAVIRVKNSVITEQSKIILQEYLAFELCTLEEYLKHNITKHVGVDDVLLTHYTLATTHCRLMTERDIVQLNERLSQFSDSEMVAIDVTSLSLQQFQTEQQYIKEIQKFLKIFSEKRDLNKSYKKILLIQCERGAYNEKLITCARYKTVDELKEWKNKTKIDRKQSHVYVIFLVPLFKEAHGSKFSSFCGGDWNTVHIDNICTVDYEELPSLSALIGNQFYEMFGESELEQESERIFWKKRLKQCIQSAASRLIDCKGSEERALVRMQQFICLTLQDTNYDFFWKVCHILKEQLKASNSSSFDRSFDWIELIANCKDNLQSSGTFRKAVNLYINSVVTPILSELIAYVDRNGNLELLNSERNDEFLTEVWQNLFNDENMFMKHFGATLLPRRRVPVLSDGLGGRFFQVKFPFSFFIQEDTANLWNEFISQEQTSVQNWHRWEQYFFNSDLGRLISNTRLEGSYQYNIFYLFDFIQMKIFPKTQEQYRVYEFAILSYIEQLSLSEEGSDSIISRKELTISKIHYAYENSRQLLDLLQESFLLENSFGERIFAQIPKMRESPDYSRKFYLEIVLLEEIINLCNHYQTQISSREETLKYVTEIRRWNSVIEKTLTLYRQNCEDYRETHFYTTIRNKWNRVKIIHLCMYYCRLGVDSVEGDAYTKDSINLLCTMFKEDSDFTTSETISYISTTLSHFVAKPRGTTELFATKCFIKILTDITFKCLPKNDDELNLDCMTINEQNMQEVLNNDNVINIFKGKEIYFSLSFKTYLLQLLIKYRKDVFTEIFKNHSFLSQQITSKQICMIFTYSLEDTLHKRIIHEDYGETMLDALMTESKQTSEVSFSFELLDKIASLRFDCVFLSQRIMQHLQSGTQTTDDLNKYKQICVTGGNENFHIFLLKQIYHNLGSDMLNMIVNSDCKWLLPTPTTGSMDKYSYALDYFLIYEDTYKMVKKAIEETCDSQDTSYILKMFTVDTKSQKDIEIYSKYLLYSIFTIISDAIKDEKHEDFNLLSDLFTTELCNIYNDNLIRIALMVIGRDNKIYFQHSHDSKNEEIALAGLIYHMAILLSSDAFPQIFAPISLIYQNPSALKNMFFPTMVGNTKPLSIIAQKSEAGHWNVCNNGHPYFVESHQHIHARICSECGVSLGEKDEEAKRVNIQQDHGYILGDVGCLEIIILHSIRSLSPASVSIIRALMDMTFLWSSCFKLTTNDELLNLVTGGPRNPEDVPDFFYQHLYRVVSDLARQTTVNFDEATLILHLVIKSLTQAAREQCTIDTNLATDELRSNWEQKFEDQFIQPFLNFPSNVVQNAMETVLVEDMIAKNEIFAAVHERKESTNSLHSCLWHYKPPVSLEDFCQKFSLANRHIGASCPFLEMFLKEERSLSIVRYLPDIVLLQRRMIEMYNHRLNKQEAFDCTIQTFLGKIDDLRVKEELKRLVNVLCEAWNKMGSRVKKCGRLQMDRNYPNDLTDDNSLSYLLASSTGNGLLITALTDYLVLIHNSFVLAYIDIVKESHIEKIPLHELSTSHVIDYEEHFQSLLLSHAYYSLGLGKGGHMSYDFEGVEQHFMEEFIQNRPLIIAEHLRFEYIREPHNWDVFEQVRQKVQQRPLKETIWRPIREDLDSLEVLSDVLIVLDVVIGFLVGTGGHPEQKLSFYLHEVLKYPTDVHGTGPLESQSADEVLLTHVLSFWNFLSIEQARKLSILGQLPFSSLKSEFRQDICDEMKKQLRDSCNRFSVQDVLKHLHQFILFYVRESEELDANKRLNDRITIYSTQFKLDTPAGFSEYFPKDIKLNQCIAAWVVLAQQEHHISNPRKGDL